MASCEKAPGLPGTSENGRSPDGLTDAFLAIEDARTNIEAARGTKTTQLLDRAGTAYATVQSAAASVQDTVSVVQPVFDSDPMKAIREGVTALVEGLPGVLKALDEVANIHPFIKIAVGAFRVVVELDAKRRDNEKKITVIFVEMKDMMVALLQLREVKDDDVPGPGGTTIKARLQTLIERTADDIKACANACDTYSKKKLLVKVIKSSSWDDKFKSFLTLFADRKKAFSFALDVHVGKAVDDANRKLDAVDVKLSAILECFSTLVSLDQQQLQNMVNSRGGLGAVLQDDSALVTLLKFKSSSSPGGPKGANSQLDKEESDPQAALKSLKEDLIESADIAMQKNMDMFDRKFAMQQRRLADEMKGLVRHESDRVIDSVLSGPHDRIKDRDIHELWKEMRWRGHVKARHCILALRDFYLQQTNDPENPTAAAGARKDDNWAIEYINVNYVSAIAEAFDDDASGFITISEVNMFTSSRPQGWSLLHWLAYWATGWRMASTLYVRKIQDLFAQMFAMVPHIRSENKKFAYDYLEEIWDSVTLYTQSFDCAEENDELWARFEEYVAAEEVRLENNLDAVNYYIDDPATLLLITGPGRIERFFLPLLYLLVRRHLDIFRLAHRRAVLDSHELVSSSYSISNVVYHAQMREWVLTALFKQRNLNPEECFKTFAHGLYNFAYKPDQLWKFKILVDIEFPRVEYHEEEIEKELPGLDIFYCQTPSSELFAAPPHGALSANDLQASGNVKAVLGRWYGFYEDVGWWPAYAMSTFFLHAPTPDTFEAKSHDSNGAPYTISGHCPVIDGEVVYDMRLTYSATLRPRILKGRLSEDGKSLYGRWKDGEDAPEFDFHFTRLPPEVLNARPAPSAFRENRTDALWRFALNAARSEARQRLGRLSSRYIKDFIDKKNLFLRLTKIDVGDHTPEQQNMLYGLFGELTYDEARYCYALSELQNVPPDAPAYYCNRCRDNIFGVHYTCVPCTLADDQSSVDLCDKAECRDARFKEGPNLHLPSHDMLRVRSYINYWRDLPWLLRKAREIIDDVDKRFKAKGSQVDTAETGHDASSAEVGEDEVVSSDEVVPSDEIVSSSEDAPEDVERGPESSPDSDTASTPASVVDADADADDDPVTEPSAATSEGAVGAVGAPTIPAPPACVSCAMPVKLPFLICVDCHDREKVYICQACDEKHGGVSGGRAHASSHSLLRCTPRVVDELDEGLSGEVEARLRGLESQVASYSAHFTALDERMHRMEQLLETLLARLPAPGT
ncbi:hypothetical protein C8Q79DRAFT_777424 [Trametes meyenii]|nr:hypothetical protein C8Q79DRAFT_777424 [Trametes meyenii]